MYLKVVLTLLLVVLAVIAVQLTRMKPGAADIPSAAASTRRTPAVPGAAPVGPPPAGAPEGLVFVDRPNAAPRGIVTRFYTVRDLLDRWWDPKSPPYDDVFFPSGEDRVEGLTSIITKTVAPDSWRDAGGKEGDILEWSGVLVILQTPENHRDIERLLESLRRAALATPATRPSTAPASRPAE
jgi:hypothetical protein